MGDGPRRRAFLRGSSVVAALALCGCRSPLSGRMDVNVENWTDAPRSLAVRVTGPRGEEAFGEVVDLDANGDVRFEDALPTARFRHREYLAVGRLPDGTESRYPFRNRAAHSRLEVEVGPDGDGGTDVFLQTL